MINLSKLLNLNKEFILASASPRREKLLLQCGFHFKVMPANIDENNLSTDISPDEHVKILSFNKADHIAKAIDYHAIILGSDTIVVLDNQILNKPVDKENAFEMLRKLSGRTHTVFTGITLMETPEFKSVTKVQKTLVTFRELTDIEINAYIETGSPMDKAGAYGIQDDFGAVFVRHIEGCYYNIVGLPLELLYSTLTEFLKNK